MHSKVYRPDSPIRYKTGFYLLARRQLRTAAASILRLDLLAVSFMFRVGRGISNLDPSKKSEPGKTEGRPILRRREPECLSRDVFQKSDFVAASQKSPEIARFQDFSSVFVGT